MDDVAKSEAFYQTQAAVLGWMLGPAAECAAQALASTLPPKAAILDIGAGVGEDTLAFSKDVGPGGRVLSVEAHPGTFRMLEKTCAQCHEGSKLKGRLSVETLASLLKGGKHGPAVVPGKPMESR